MIRYDRTVTHPAMIALYEDLTRRTDKAIEIARNRPAPPLPLIPYDPVVTVYSDPPKPPPVDRGKVICSRIAAAGAIPAGLMISGWTWQTVLHSPGTAAGMAVGMGAGIVGGLIAYAIVGSIADFIRRHPVLTVGVAGFALWVAFK